MNQAQSIVVWLFCCGGAWAQLSDGLYAAFDTSMGSFTCRLDYVEVPLTCANFVGLAEGSQHWLDPETGSIRSDPFYDGLLFHRTITNFMIQGGDPLGTGTGGPGYAIPDEFDPALAHSTTGVLSMANSGPDSGGSQFFITLKETSWLDNKHAVFGAVVDGMDVVHTLSEVPEVNDRPIVDVVMNQVRILRIGTQAGNFDPLAQPLPEVRPLPLHISNSASGWVVSASSASLSKDALYQKATLDSWVDWTGIETNYWQTGNSGWTAAVATHQTSQFFKGIRIFHPQASTATLAGHTLTLGNLILQPTAGGGGSAFYDGSPRDIYAWGFEPAYSSYYFDIEGLIPLSFEFDYATPSNGAYVGFAKYSASGWQPISGPFTDSPGQ